MGVENRPSFNPTQEGEPISPDLIEDINTIPVEEKEQEWANGTVWFLDNDPSSYQAFSQNLAGALPEVGFKSYGNVDFAKQELTKDIPDVLFVGDVETMDQAEVEGFIQSLPANVKVIRPEKNARRNMLSRDYVRVFNEALAEKEQVEEVETLPKAA